MLGKSSELNSINIDQVNTVLFFLWKPHFLKFWAFLCQLWSDMCSVMHDELEQQQQKQTTNKQKMSIILKQSDLIWFDLFWHIFHLQNCT